MAKVPPAVQPLLKVGELLKAIGTADVPLPSQETPVCVFAGVITSQYLVPFVKLIGVAMEFAVTTLPAEDVATRLNPICSRNAPGRPPASGAIQRLKFVPPEGSVPTITLASTRVKLPDGVNWTATVCGNPTTPVTCAMCTESGDARLLKTTTVWPWAIAMARQPESVISPTRSRKRLTIMIYSPLVNESFASASSRRAAVS